VNTEKKDNMKNDGAWKAVHEALSTEVQEHLEKKLKKTLNAFPRIPAEAEADFFLSALGSAFPVGRHGIGRSLHYRIFYFGKQTAHMGGGARAFWLHAFFCSFNL
jgi:hypothetical protein